VNRYLKGALIILTLLVVAGLLTAWLLPSAVQALPGQVRGRLPQRILRAVTTPLPTALPTPIATAAEIEAIIAEIAQQPTATPQATPSPPPTATRPSPLATRHSPRATRDLPTATRHAPRATRLDGLEIVPQKLNNCGPATLSINLNYYGLEQTQFDVAQIVKPHYDDRNVSPEELVDYTNNHTELRASLYRAGNLEIIKKLIAAGFPVVIEKGYEPDEWQGWMGHYLTLYGYDDSSEQFDTIDTFLGPWDNSGLLVDYKEIETGWQHFNYTFYVVYKKSQAQLLADLTGPILNDQQTMWQEAVSQAQTNISEEPQNAFAWFNLGSSLTRLGHINDDSSLINGAVAAFDQARILGLPPRMLWYQFELYEAYLAAGRIEDVLTLTTAVLENAGGRDVEETYLYRGHALLAQGDLNGARSDYQRALELRPGFAAAVDALEQAKDQ